MPVQFSEAITAERYYRAIERRLHRADVFEWFISPRGPLGKKAERGGIILPSPADVSGAPPAIAHLNRWRWMVACPDCAQDFQLAFNEPRLFLCSKCWNEDAGGTWRRYVFPENRREIEIALDSQGAPREARNCLPGWTVERVSIEAASRSPIGFAEYLEALKVTA